MRSDDYEERAARYSRREKLETKLKGENMYRIRIEKVLPGNVEDAEKRLNGDIENKIEPTQIGWIDGFDFSLFMQDLLISGDGYVIDTGNYENVNYVCAHSLLNRIKRHPWIWKWFFMVG